MLISLQVSNNVNEFTRCKKKKSLSHHLLNRCIDLALLGNRGTNTNMEQIYGIRTKTFNIKETE